MKNIFGRNLIKRSDVFVIFLTVLLIFSSFILFHPATDTTPVATITINGKVEEKINLTLQKDCIITLKTEPVVKLEIKNHKIRFIESLCPDGTCEKMGYLSKAGDTAACIPAKVIVTVNGTEDSTIDAIAG